ncbi:MAG: urea ABC transporter ATP-binding subunit UrtE [Pseudomonadota bacterium]
MLDVSALSLKYGQSQILYDVSLTARVGAITAVMGNNGVGKTSLLKAIAGRHPFFAGSVRVDGTELAQPTAHQAARAGIAYVPQGREVFPMMSVQENLETGFACLPKSEHGIADDIFDLFPVLRDMRARRGGDLSGGQQQQLAIARALITRPKVLLLDEPTEGIQPNIIQQIGSALETLREAGKMAIVLVEQNADFAFRLADQYVVLTRGEVTSQAVRGEMTKQQILEQLTL